MLYQQFPHLTPSNVNPFQKIPQPQPTPKISLKPTNSPKIPKKSSIPQKNNKKFKKMQAQQQRDPQLQNTIIPESKKLLNQRSLKEFKISVQLVMETSVDQGMVDGLSEEEKIQAVLELKSIHLEWLNIRKIQNLEVFSQLSILYLQYNKISKIQNLQCLQNLQYLALNNNLIQKVQNLSQLKKLSGLNLNYNQIQQIDPQQLPTSLQLLSFKQNPVTLDANYRADLVRRLPVLEVLDDCGISAEERLKIVGRFPQHLIEYSEKMKQFRNKQKAKKQLQEQQNKKPMYLGSINNEQEALKQIRDKTMKFLGQAQETFKADIKEQKQDFQSKIKVSRKIRTFKQQNQAGKKKRMSSIVQTAQQHNNQT